MSLENTIALIADVIKTHKPRFVTDKVLLSVLTQESNCEAFFQKTDEQYKENMKVATTLLHKTEAEVLALVSSKDKIFKFRTEPGTFSARKYESLSPERKFYLSTSVGLGQLMGFNLFGPNSTQMASIFNSFALDEHWQVVEACNMFDDLMARAEASPQVKDKSLKSLTFHAYCGYNSGKIISTDQAVIARANEVAGRV